ncbi:hypothetical protein Ciccas_004439 [Cichlidogyrus casuarinus]|uniref:Uncharacterized protein n=1 Tax=Cichlidogyrus casuarinus TaxID=1844966 RepID=A0ABD2QBG8_9PLAT
MWPQERSSSVDILKKNCSNILLFEGAALVPVLKQELTVNSASFFSKRLEKCDLFCTVLNQTGKCLTGISKDATTMEIKSIDSSLIECRGQSENHNWSVYKNNVKINIETAGPLLPSTKLFGLMSKKSKQECIVSMCNTISGWNCYALTDLGRLLLVQSEEVMCVLQVELDAEDKQIILICSPDGHWLILNARLDKLLTNTCLIRLKEKTTDTQTRWVLKPEFGFFQGVNRPRNLWIPNVAGDLDMLERRISNAIFINNDRMLIGIHTINSLNGDFVYSVAVSLLLDQCWQIVAKDDHTLPQFLWTLNLFHFTCCWPKEYNFLNMESRKLEFLVWDWNEISIYTKFSGGRKKINLATVQSSPEECKLITIQSRPQIANFSYEPLSRTASIAIHDITLERKPSIQGEKALKFKQKRHFANLLIEVAGIQVEIPDNSLQLLKAENPRLVSVHWYQDNVNLVTLSEAGNCKLWNKEMNLEATIPISTIMPQMLQILPTTCRPRALVYDQKNKSIELVQFKKFTDHEVLNPMDTNEAFHYINETDLIQVVLRDRLHLFEIDINGHKREVDISNLDIRLKNPKGSKILFMKDENNEMVLIVIASKTERIQFDGNSSQLVIVSLLRESIEGNRSPRLAGYLPNSTSKWLLDCFQWKTNLLILSCPARNQSKKTDSKSPWEEESQWLVNEGTVDELSVPNLSFTCSQRRFICPWPIGEYQKVYQVWSANLNDVPAAFSLTAAVEAQVHDKKTVFANKISPKATQPVSMVVNLNPINDCEDSHQNEILILNGISFLSWNLGTGLCKPLKSLDKQRPCTVKASDKEQTKVQITAFCALAKSVKMVTCLGSVSASLFVSGACDRTMNLFQWTDEHLQCRQKLNLDHIPLEISFDRKCLIVKKEHGFEPFLCSEKTE